MEKPDFSGVWRFNRSRSSLQIQSPDSTTFVIKHREPYFRLERTHTFGGKADFFAIDLKTDDIPVELVHDGMKIRARIHWEAEALVFYSKLSREDVRGTNIVQYRLAEKGHTFIALEQLSFADQSHKNIWVFDKQ